MGSFPYDVICPSDFFVRLDLSVSFRVFLQQTRSYSEDKPHKQGLPFSQKLVFGVCLFKSEKRFSGKKCHSPSFVKKRDRD